MTHAVSADPVLLLASGARIPMSASCGLVLGVEHSWRSEDGLAFFEADLGAVSESLPAGWYRITFEMGGAPGDVLDPSISVGARGPVAGMVRQSLPLVAGARQVTAIILLEHDVTILRLRPARRPADFSFSGLRLVRLGRLRALLGMLGPWSGGVLPSIRRSGRFALCVAKAGLSRAAAVAFQSYRDRCFPPPPNSYSQWVDHYDSPTVGDFRALRARARALEVNGPLVSILMPVYQTPERWLRRSIESVIAQTYGRWELCIVDDASPGRRVAEVLEEYRAADPRIRVLHRSQNGHISAASNSALEMATGQYIALLDHDDELRPHALFSMMKALSSNPSARLLYSDEDKIDEMGRRFDPYFKPDWDADLLLSQNYLCHFTMLDSAVVESVGGFREGFEGAQDHDLFLRVSRVICPSEVMHVPGVLYHWRAVEGSTALSRNEKDYAAEAGLRAVDDHLLHLNPDAKAELLPQGHYRVRWPLPRDRPRISLVIPTRDRHDLLRMCLDSVFFKTRYSNYEVIVVDNCSREAETFACLEEYRQKHGLRIIQYDAPFNYSAINNVAVEQASGELVCLLNNDVEVITPDWLDEMASHALRPGVGAVGAMLYYPNDLIQHAGVVLGVGGVANHAFSGLPRGHGGYGGRARVVQSYSAVTGACMMVRRSLYRELGGLDERLRVAFNDVDFCLRLRAIGYRNIWTPHAELYHHESASRGVEDNPEKQARFQSEVDFMLEHWGSLLAQDPAYNQNLTLAYADQSFGLAWPPRIAAVAREAGAGSEGGNCPQ